MSTAIGRFCIFSRRSAVIQSFTAYWYSDKIVLAQANAPAGSRKRDNPELYRIVENLCIAAVCPRPGRLAVQLVKV